MDLISVIVPVYNGEAYLADCIASIECQTYQNLEIIIINDGSTDGTGKVCTALQETYANVRIITLQDEGVSAARNAGIEAAKGDFITFVDADDRLRPKMIQVLYDCLIDTKSDIAGCRFFIWKDETEWKEFSERDEETSLDAPQLYTPDTYVRDAILQGNSRCWSKLYRRTAVGRTRFRTGLSIGEDMLFLVDMLESAEKITETTYVGYGYFQNPKGAINRGFTPKYMDQITCWEIAREKISSMKKISSVKFEKEQSIQATAILMMGIMLTAGKLAMLSYAERKEQKKYVQVCHDKLKEAMRIKGAYGKLSIGYKVKTGLFRCFPNLYLLLYHWRKAD